MKVTSFSVKPRPVDFTPEASLETTTAAVKNIVELVDVLEKLTENGLVLRIANEEPNVKQLNHHTLYEERVPVSVSVPVPV